MERGHDGDREGGQEGGVGVGGEARGGSHRGCQPGEEQSHHVEASVPLPARRSLERRDVDETQDMGDKDERGVVRTWGGAEGKRLILSIISASDDLM